MVMHDLESSFLKAVGYDKNYKRMELHFSDGQQYEYYHVPVQVFDSFLAAESHGRFYNACVKGQYDETKIIGPHDESPKKRRSPPAPPFPPRRRA